MMQVGDRVNWQHTPRGGYGYSVCVAGIVTKIAAKRVQIRVAVRSGNEWQQVTKWVEPARLNTREKPVPELDGA